MNTFIFLGTSLLGTLAVLASVSTGTADDTVFFEPLEMDAPAATIAVSEDGAWLFSAHEAANEVLVWSVPTGERAAVIETESPRALLHRQGVLYVGSFGAGHVRAFAEKEDWDLENEFRLPGKLRMHNLSAPKGKDFQRVLLVNAAGEKGSVGFVLDVRRGQHRPAVLKDAAYLDAVGKQVALYGDNFYGPGNVTFSQLYSELLAGKEHTPARSRDHCHFVPGYDGVHWFGSGFVWAGNPPQPVHDEDQGTVIPDLGRNLYYSLKDGVLTARILSGSLPEVGHVSYEFSPEFQGGSLLYDHRTLRFYEPVAVTEGDRLLIYVLDATSQKVFRAEAPAFEVLSVAPGRRLEHALSGGDPGTYSLVDGPPGLSISPDGLMTWTPSSRALGAHVVRFRYRSGGRAAIEQQAVEVVRAAGIAAAAPPAPEAKEAVAADSAQRIWADATGKFRVRAEYVGLSEGKVQLRREDGRVVEVPLDRLSAVDQQWVRAAAGVWTTLVADEGFRIDFPGKPNRHVLRGRRPAGDEGVLAGFFGEPSRQQETDGEGNESIGYGYLHPEPPTAYLVAITRLGEAAGADPDAMLEAICSMHDDALVSRQPIQLGDHKGIKAIAHIEALGTRQEVAIRIFVTRSASYHVMVLYAPEDAGAARIARFLDSFRLPGAMAQQDGPAAQKTWTDATGKFSLEAELVQVVGDSVVLRMADGTERTVALARLSAADQQYAQSARTQEGGDPVMHDDAAPAEAAQFHDPDLEKLQGDWIVTSRFIFREELAAEKGKRWRIEGSELTEVDDERVRDLKLDSTKDPKAIDLDHFLGIYRLEGDTLSICHAMFGNDRPTEFSHNDLRITLKRSK